MQVVEPLLQGNASGVMNAIRQDVETKSYIERDPSTQGTRVRVRCGSPQEPGVA